MQLFPLFFQTVIPPHFRHCRTCSGNLTMSSLASLEKRTRQRLLKKERPNALFFKTTFPTYLYLNLIVFPVSFEAAVASSTVYIRLDCRDFEFDAAELLVLLPYKLARVILFSGFWAYVLQEAIVLQA